MINNSEQYHDYLDQIEVFPVGKIFRISYDMGLNQMRLVSKDIDAFNEIRRVFSVENKAAFFSKQYGYKIEDRLYNINKFGYFKPGLIYKILGWIREQYGSLNCVAVSEKTSRYIKDYVKPLATYINALGGKITISNIAEDSGVNDQIRIRIAKLIDDGVDPDQIKEQPLEFRDYQKKSVEALLTRSFGRGMIEIPTAGGKSFILANFIWNVMKKINMSYKFMLLVPNVQLVEQMYKDFIFYGFNSTDIAKFKGGMSKSEKKINDVKNAKIIIANRQYVFKNMRELPKFDALIADECHQNCAKASQQLIDDMDAKIKVGCSGTIPEDLYLRNTLIGMFGDIVYKENVTDLQREGFISKLDITVINIFDKNVDADRNLLFHINSNKKYVAEDFNSDIRFDDAVRAEHEYIVKWYKDLYRPVLDHIRTLNGNTLVLFDKLDIGTSLYEFFKENFGADKTFYNDGQTKVDIREETRRIFEESDGNVLFANVQIMSTGINIKRLHNIAFCFSSKSTTRIIQSIGRSLRLYEDKEQAHLIDCVFNFKYSQRHYKERLQLYRKFYNKSHPDKILRIEI